MDRTQAGGSVIGRLLNLALIFVTACCLWVAAGGASDGALTELADRTPAGGLKRDTDYPVSASSVSACGASSVSTTRPEPVVTNPCADGRYQGRSAKWWAKRAVQARKDANARGRTIRRLQNAARSRLVYPTGHWLDGAFLCIHRYERGAGGWQTATGNGYYGGLQMDSSFQRTYGPEWARKAFGKSAHLWPASVQIAAAIQAWTSRGFGPWPNTRRSCGL